MIENLQNIQNLQNSQTTQNMDNIKINKKNKLIYENYIMCNKMGKIIGLCGKKKFQWYIKMGLAEIIDDKKLQINFDHVTESALKIKPNKDSLIESQKKPEIPELTETPEIPEPKARENKCSGCGTLHNLLKFRVIPYTFKRYLPKEYKSHNPFDILPLCNECECYAKKMTEKFKKLLETEYNISPNHFIDQKKAKIKSMAKKILNCKKKLNISTSEAMIKLTELLGHLPTESELNDISNDNINIIYEEAENEYEYIVRKVIKNGQIYEFIQRWKQNFIENVDPLEVPHDFYYLRPNDNTQI